MEQLFLPALPKGIVELVGDEINLRGVSSPPRYLILSRSAVYAPSDGSATYAASITSKPKLKSAGSIGFSFQSFFES